MQQEANTLKKNSIYSLLSLFFQSGYSAILGFAANIILTIVLSPKIFGIYILTLSIISFFNYFSDIGLAASLVQKKDVTNNDLRTTFTIQQILIITLVSIGFFLTPLVSTFYKLPNEAIYLYWALLIGFFLSSLKTIPSIKLEREVQYQKIVFVQIVENTIFYVIVSVLAIAKMGLYSFAYAVIIRSTIGVVLIYSLSFWKPSFGITRDSLKKLLSFGIPFQANTVLALIKDDLIMLFLGKALGLEALGYIGWAKRWAESPIRIIMDNVTKILFPILSRIQNERDRISNLMEKVVKYQTLILAPAFVGMLLLMSRFVELIPKYNKWEPAIPLFYLFAIAAFFSSYSSPFINLFNSLGKIKISLKFMVYWTVMSWILIPLFTAIFGIYGFPIALIILSLTFVVIVYLAKKIISIFFLKQVVPGIVAGGCMAFIVYIVTLQTNSLFNFFISSISGLVTYVVVLYAIFKINIISEVASFIKYD